MAGKRTVVPNAIIGREKDFERQMVKPTIGTSTTAREQITIPEAVGQQIQYLRIYYHGTIYENNTLLKT